jgi:acyl-CoA synthetase (AMP-forming)/AMP-acid ligase II
MLTHRSLAAGVTNSAIARPLAADDVYLFPFPLFHVAAYNVLHAHLRRRPVVLVPRFDAATVLELIGSEGVTCCSLAPTMVAMLLDHPGRTASSLAGLRQISYGAAAMPLDLLQRVLEELPHCGLAQGYGMTELSGNAVFLTPEDHRRAASDEPGLLAAAGRPGPLVGLQIVDDEDREVPAGEPGEILVRGDQVCAGYWEDPAATADSRRGPWLRTGDVGRVIDGVLYVVDRKKDLIITGGENVASREVEDLVGQHPDVAQVAVVGVPDERWGETICAVVVPAPDRDGIDVDELVRWTDGRIAGFKRPRRVVVVDELPLNASGKVDKGLVRALVTDRDAG